MRTFFTITDQNTQYTNSRSKRFPSFGDAVQAAGFRFKDRGTRTSVIIKFLARKREENGRKDIQLAVRHFITKPKRIVVSLGDSSRVYVFPLPTPAETEAQYLGKIWETLKERFASSPGEPPAIDTPLKVDVLMHYCRTSILHPCHELPAVIQATEWLMQHGALVRPPGQEYYQITELGAAWVKAIRNTRCPTRKTVFADEHGTIL